MLLMIMRLFACLEHFLCVYMVLRAPANSPASYLIYRHTRRTGNAPHCLPATRSHGKTVQRFSQTGDYDESYQSQSTFSPDESCEFHEGSHDRAKQLNQALQDVGVDVTALRNDPIWKGSAALRSYSSFILPKSAGALAMTQQPQRAAVVANSIAFLMREQRAHRNAWLRNHDRSLQQADQLWASLPHQQQRQKVGGSSSNSSNRRNPIILILDNVRSAANVGNILRCAEAARCQQVWLCGSMTPSPPQAAVLKTAVGAADHVPFKTMSSTLQAVRELKQQQQPNVTVFGVETTSNATPLWQVDLFSRHQQQQQQQQQQPREHFLDCHQVAFVFGNELVAVDTNVLLECDGLVSVPMYGIKNSLNVASCASIVIWEALRQREQLFLQQQ